MSTIPTVAQGKELRVSQIRSAIQYFFKGNMWVSRIMKVKMVLK